MDVVNMNVLQQLNRRNMKRLLNISCILLLLISSCKKEGTTVVDTTTTETETETETETIQEFSFTSLTTVEDTLQVYSVTDIEAIATGENLTYTWDKDLGVILGSGSKIVFNVCCEGQHEITCTVSDGVNSKSLSVNVFGIL